MEEIHHTQSRRQVPSSHQVGCHHGDQGHIGAVKVTVENGKGHEEQERPQQRHKEAAEAFHHHREDVTYQTVGLQTPKGKRKALTLVQFTRFGLKISRGDQMKRDSYFLSVSQPKVTFPTMFMTPRIDIRKAALCWLRPLSRAYGTR